MREKSKSSGSGTKQCEESLLLLYQYNNVNQFRDIYLLRKFCVAGKNLLLHFRTCSVFTLKIHKANTKRTPRNMTHTYKKVVPGL